VIRIRITTVVTTRAVMQDGVRSSLDEHYTGAQP